ncbi:MAG: Alkyl hydroperoxide reductase/thiol specific antioxidant/Mal allergen [Frankiales bacterium]|nr:Alkyl hydroperoxide reductase/thiol specific antioxidant/Mal allergen [Frankiales bacterium]
MRTPSIRAPEFPSGTWFNTDSALSLRGLRGKIVLLDFWTFCCGNCLHVLDELHDIESRYRDEVVIVGVHSPKFEHEKSDHAVAAAVQRYAVAHPVLNDPDLYLWRQYAVRAWPTLLLIDPNGYVVAQAAGEGQVGALAIVIDELIREHDADGTLRRGASPYQPPEPVDHQLRFPAKAVRLGDSLFAADAGHDSIAELSLDGQQLRRRLDAGHDLLEPNGLTVLPPGIASQVGFDLVVADTGHHRLVCLRSSDGTVATTVDLPAKVAGVQTVTGPIPSVLSPWDVAWWPAAHQVAIAAAGVHLLLGWNPITDAVSVLAGTTVEGLRDGPAQDGWLAQPSGLAVAGDRLWFVDSETSALRYLGLDGILTTVVGEGLFDFGHVDGPAAGARFQHPLGVAVAPDGTVLVADTYNGAVRRYDPIAGTVSTIRTGLDEPSGLVFVDEVLLAVEANAHRLVPVEVGATEPAGETLLSTDRPSTDVSAGSFALRVRFTAPAGRKLDDRYGPATRLVISSSPPSLIAAGGGDGTELSRELTLAGNPGARGILHVTAQAASCDDDVEDHPACYLARQDWGVPIRIDSAGEGELELLLLG